MIRTFLLAFVLAATLGLLGAAGITYASVAPPRPAGEWAPIGLSLGGTEIAAVQPEPAPPTPIDQAGWAARKQRVRLSEEQRRRLAALGAPLGRRRPAQIATIGTPDAILRCAGNSAPENGRTRSGGLDGQRAPGDSPVGRADGTDSPVGLHAYPARIEGRMELES